MNYWKVTPHNFSSFPSLPGSRVKTIYVNGFQPVSRAVHWKTGLTLTPELSHVLLCGNSGMLQDALIRLEKRGMQRHRRREPGHVSMEKYH